jgi:outer membrane lipoprotein carrier protein
MRRWLTPLLFCLTTTATAFAAESARAKLDSFAKDLKSVSAQFEQHMTDPNKHSDRTSRGTLALKAPRQFQ